MDEHEEAMRHDDPVEGGALDSEGEGDREAGGMQEQSAESGELAEQQEGKGYGQDEGERGGTLSES